MANKHTKRYSMWLIFREMQIKNTIRYHLTLIRMGIIKKFYKQEMMKRLWRKGNSLILLVGMQIDTATMENSMEGP